MGQAPDELMSREDLAPMTGGTPPSEQENPSIPDLRDEIAQTRTEMSGTIDALESRLSPEALVEQAKAKVRTEAEEGLDLAGELFREYVQQPAERGIGFVAERAQQVASELPVYLRVWQEQLEVQSSRLLARARKFKQENPVAFAAVLAGIGAGLGVAAVLVARTLNRVGDE